MTTVAKNPSATFPAPGPAAGSRLALVVFLYALSIGCLVGRRPLWVDEILQLIGTTSPSTAGVLQWVSINPGAAPLAYLIQHWFVSIFGISTAAVRFPAAAFSILSCIALWAAGKTLGLGNVLAAVVTFAALPLQFRYGVEARPYSQAIFFTTMSLLGFASLAATPSAANGALYCLWNALGLYTQPFSFLPTLAQPLASLLGWRDRRTRGTFVIVCAAALLALASFAPWYLRFRLQWRATIVQSLYSFVVGYRTPLMMLREISGAGYAGSIPLLLLAGYGLWSPAMSAFNRRLLGLSILVPVVCALVADAAFNYFFATRQIVFVLPAVALAAGEGWGRLYAHRRVLAVALFAGMMAAFGLKNIRNSIKQDKDWGTAAKAIESEASSSGSCIAVVPREWGPLYSFFVPAIRNRLCGEEIGSARVLLAITPYTRGEAARSAHSELGRLGFREISRRTAGGTTIELLERAASVNR